MGCFVRGDKNCMGCFVPGGKLMRDVLSGVTKMAWDVLSRDVLSYIHKIVVPLFGANAAPNKGTTISNFLVLIST